MTTTTDDLTKRAQQAAAAHRQAQQALADRAADQAADLAERQRQWDLDVVRRHAAIGADLERQQAEATAAFDQAVGDGDLSAAFRAWVTERGYRPARQAVLDNARAAQVRTGVGQPIPDRLFTWAPLDFLERVMTAGDRQGVQAGHDLGRDLLGTRPGMEE